MVEHDGALSFVNAPCVPACGGSEILVCRRLRKTHESADPMKSASATSGKTAPTKLCAGFLAAARALLFVVVSDSAGAAALLSSVTTV